MNPETSVPSASTCSVAPVVNSNDAVIGTTASMAMTSVPQSLPALSSTSSSQGIISTPITSTSTSPSNHAMMQLPPPPTPAPTPAPAVVAPQASVHQNMLHPPFSNVTQTPLPQVQVIQQPIHGSTYLQHLYTSQQQMLLPGNLTVQPTGVAQTLQSLGTAPGVNLQLQNKPGVDPKTVGAGSTIIPASSVQSISTTGKGMALSSPNLMTAAGQVIATGGKTCMPGQMISAAKSTAVLQGQTGFVPSTTGSQTVVIGQFGMLSNQASIVPSHNKTVNESQKGKSFLMGHAASMPINKSPNFPPSKMMGQPAALQPKSSPILPCPVSSANATQVLTNTHLKHLTTSPQLITGQAPTAMIASQAQILGSLQALGASLPQGITWAAHGGLQSPTLFTQNPILIRSQQPDMFIQSPSPAFHAVPMASTAPSSHMTVIPTTPYVQKQKQVRPASSVATQTAVSTATSVQSRAPPARTQAKQRSRGQNNRGSPGGSQPHPTHPQTSTIQTQTPPLQHQKADAANQTKPTPEMKSTATQSKSVSTETGHQNLIKQSVSPLPAMAVLPKQISVEAKLTTDVQAASTNNLKKEEKDEISQDSVVETNEQPSVNVEVEPEQLEAPKKEEEVLNAPPPDTISKEKQPQKAIVKPHILTHVIDGYVILEGPEPFPVSRSSLLTDCTNLKPDPVEKPAEGDVRPVARVSTEEKVQKTPKNRGPAELSKCELCGKLGAKSKLKRSKRFCSTSCCKRYNVGCSERLGIFPPVNQQTSVAGMKYEGNKVVKKKKMGFKTRKGWRKSQGGRLAYNVSEWNTSPQTDQGTPIEIESEESVKEEREGEGETTDTPSGPESSMSPTTPSSHKEEMEVDCPEPTPIVSSSPLKWTVQEVVDFIHGLPGCTDYADEFRSQEIDGQALLLLKEDHLMTAMNMKLGPALKICACIKSLKQGIDGKCQQ